MVNKVNLMNEEGINNPMFRYLEKYVGKYRVLAPYDVEKNDFPRNHDGEIEHTFDDLYIPCSRGKSVIKHTYDNNILMWYTESIGTGRRVKDELEHKRNKIDFTYEETESESMIFFNAKDIEEIDKLVQIKTSGKNIEPYSDKNLPGIVADAPWRELERLYAITSDLSRSEKTAFSKQTVEDFDKVIKQKMGKGYNVKKEKEKSRMSGRAFIYSIGMWEDYLLFVQQQYKKKYKK